jgi:hypothetical protein
MIQSWFACCAVLRFQPIINFISGFKEPSLFLHGQRKSDNPLIPGPDFDLSAIAATAADCRVVGPIWDWRDEDVWRYLHQEQVALPDHYREGVTESLDCAICPAKLNGGRVSFARSRHPEIAGRLISLAQTVDAAARGALDDERAHLIDRATPSPRVYQRLGDTPPSDCAIATLATMAGVPYEAAARLLGRELDPVSGRSAHVVGHDAQELVAALLGLGIQSMHIVGAEKWALGGASPPMGVLSSAEIKQHIAGRRAILVVDLPDTGDWGAVANLRPLHAVGWDGRDILDPHPRADRRGIAETTVYEAIVL